MGIIKEIHAKRSRSAYTPSGLGNCYSPTTTRTSSSLAQAQSKKYERDTSLTLGQRTIAFSITSLARNGQKLSS
jgi:hypothetical protein